MSTADAVVLVLTSAISFSFGLIAAALLRVNDPRR